MIFRGRRQKLIMASNYRSSSSHRSDLLRRVAEREKPSSRWNLISISSIIHESHQKFAQLCRSPINTYSTSVNFLSTPTLGGGGKRRMGFF